MFKLFNIYSIFKSERIVFIACNNFMIFLIVQKGHFFSFLGNLNVLNFFNGGLDSLREEIPKVKHSDGRWHLYQVL